MNKTFLTWARLASRGEVMLSATTWLSPSKRQVRTEELGTDLREDLGEENRVYYAR